MAELHRLNALQVTRISEPGRYADGGGLYLRVAEYSTKAGMARSKNWVFRFERAGQERWMGLGPLGTLTLADARQRARDCRKALLDGLDPIADRQTRRDRDKVAAAKVMTFKACADAYIKAHRPTWKNPKHAEQWPSTLTTYVYPRIGALPVSSIDTSLVLKCLEPIWSEIPDSARRIRGRIEAVLDWAKARKYRDGDNPARWRGHLKILLSDTGRAGTVKHHAALPYSEVPTFMAGLRSRADVSSKALEFTILTAARTSESIGARRSEIDFEKKLWTVPGERMKSRRQHIVPLSDRAIEIARALPADAAEDDPFLFAGARAGRSLSNMAMLELLRGLRPGYTVHGFRSSFRDWAGDMTAYPQEVVEAALAHVISDKTEAAYRRLTAIEKRRRLMGEWAKFCAVPSRRAGGNVTSIGS